MSISAYSQNLKITLYGKITDNFGYPVAFANIVLADGINGTSSNENGYYELSFKPDSIISISVSCIGYETNHLSFSVKNNERKLLNITLNKVISDIQGVNIVDDEVRNTTFERLDPKIINVIPNTTGDIGTLIKTLPGVASSNELSSQYSVRGGNYDENIVYVNGIEVFRPFLTRTGQHEGLSFVNPDLVSSISFSAGGFEAKYGDKMSSVLDIIYKKPAQFHASASISLLSASLHVEGNINKFSYLMGFRQKSTSYMLGAMDAKGEYKPSFSDIQILLDYNINKKFGISLLGNYAINIYKFIPEFRYTTFGGISESYSLATYMEGNEYDKFNNGMGALSFNYYPDVNNNISLILSAYQSSESEKYDIYSDYYLSELEVSFGEHYGKEKDVIGVGTFFTHARNLYNSAVYTADIKGKSVVTNHLIHWGLQYRHENVYDFTDKWKMVDSAGFTLPHIVDSLGYTFPSLQPDFNLEMFSNVKAINSLLINRVSAFAQDAWNIDGNLADFMIIYGLRATFSDINKECKVSPRLTVSAKPHWDKDVLFRFSTGYYFQPPSYREMKDEFGALHTNLRSQQSIHFVLGSDLNFFLWKRKFKFITDLYYKYLDNLVPYTIDNVMIQYHPEYVSSGFATGIDMKLIGNLVEGVDSWISLSLMKTAEKLKGTDFYPRPSDQLVNFSIFLQDYIPKFPNFKVQLNLMIGTGLPVSFPDSKLFTQAYIKRYPVYKRVDLGLGWQIVSNEVKPKWNFLNHFSDVSLVLEFLNLLQISNTISYTWVTDIYGRNLGVPDYLTPRRINLKLSVAI